MTLIYSRRDNSFRKSFILEKRTYHNLKKNDMILHSEKYIYIIKSQKFVFRIPVSLEEKEEYFFSLEFLGKEEKIFFSGDLLCVTLEDTPSSNIRVLCYSIVSGELIFDSTMDINAYVLSIDDEFLFLKDKDSPGGYYLNYERGVIGLLPSEILPSQLIYWTREIIVCHCPQKKEITIHHFGEKIFIAKECRSVFSIKIEKTKIMIEEEDKVFFFDLDNETHFVIPKRLEEVVLDFYGGMIFLHSQFKIEELTTNEIRVFSSSTEEMTITYYGEEYPWVCGRYFSLFDKKLKTITFFDYLPPSSLP